MDEKSVWRFFLEFYVRLCFNVYHKEDRQMDEESVWRSFKSEKNGKKFELLPAIIEKNME